MAGVVIIQLTEGQREDTHLHKDVFDPAEIYESLVGIPQRRALISHYLSLRQ